MRKIKQQICKAECMDIIFIYSFHNAGNFSFVKAVKITNNDYKNQRIKKVMEIENTLWSLMCIKFFIVNGDT